MEQTRSILSFLSGAVRLKLECVQAYWCAPSIVAGPNDVIKIEPIDYHWEEMSFEKGGSGCAPPWVNRHANSQHQTWESLDLEFGPRLAGHSRIQGGSLEARRARGKAGRESAGFDD